MITRFNIFEKIITRNDIHKKYIILKEYDQYLLLKVLDIKQNYGVEAIVCEKIYSYKNKLLYKFNEEDVNRENNIYYITTTDIKREIVYQDDNLEKTLESLKILNDVEKYNL